MSWISLIPRQVKFFDMFKNFGGTINEIEPVLAQMVKTMLINPAIKAAMQALEQRGDEHTRELQEALQRTFITPFDREDISTLATELDNVVDNIEEVIMRMNGDAEPPAKDLLEMVRVAMLSIALIPKAIPLLSQKIKEGCFTPLREEMRELEHEGDRIRGKILDENMRPINLGSFLQRREWAAVTVADLQEYENECARRRLLILLTELLEITIDTCRDVFKVFDNIALKNA